MLADKGWHLLGAGAYFAYMQHPFETPSDLLTTPYGRTLSLKLLLVGGVLALGAMNARVWTPRLDTDHGARALRRTAGVELLLGQLVLLVTAILVRTSPGP